MNQGKYTIAILFMFLFSVANISAQKFGYLNSTLLLSEMPKVKQAQANLETLKTQLQKKGQQELAQLKSDYEAAQRKVEQGLLSPKQQEEEAARLKGKEQDLAKVEQDMMQQLSEKEKTLMQPILDAVNVAIKEVAETDGFTYIFDTSTGVLLFADEALDVTAKVKTKLGI